MPSQRESSSFIDHFNARMCTLDPGFDSEGLPSAPPSQKEMQCSASGSGTASRAPAGKKGQSTNPFIGSGEELP